MSDITELLHAAQGGDRQASDRLITLLYEDLQRLARARLRKSGDMTLNATALVHEAYVRLQGAGELEFADRKHFLAYASRVMRSIVIDQVRERQAERRGGDLVQVTFDTGIEDLMPQRDDEVLRVNEALQELATLEPRLAQVVEMRYFGGLMEAEIAQGLGLTQRTVQRDWQKARIFLSMAMK